MSLKAPPSRHRPAARLVSLRWPEPQATVTAAMPVSFGVSLPAGELREPIVARLVVPTEGDPIEAVAQAKVLGCWPNGSVRWVLLDAILPARSELAGDWGVLMEPATADLNGEEVRVLQGDGTIRVSNGLWQATFDRGGGVWRIEEDVAKSAPDFVTLRLPPITDKKGGEYGPVITEVKVEAAGPVRATVVVRGNYPSVRGLRLTARFSFFAESGLVQVEFTLHNPHRARHSGGLWDLGDEGSVFFCDFSLPVALAGGEPKAIWLQCEPDSEQRNSADGILQIYQDSSGGENWNSRNHINRDDVVPLQFAGYRGVLGGEAIAGKRAEPVVEFGTSQIRLTAIIPEFWQQFPKAIDVAGREMMLRLFPRQSADLFELQGGEQKTHRIFLQFDSRGRKSDATSGSVSDGAVQRGEDTFETSAASLREAAAVSRRQPLPIVECGWFPGLPDIREADANVIARLDELTDEFLAGPRGIRALREEVDEYGWRNYGDLHADHEEQHYRGPRPLISHYNNQFDVLCGFLLQFLRTGQSQWMELADSLASHVIDIDIYHTTEDRPAYNGGLFWFTDHYLHARTSTHRTFSRHNQFEIKGSYGGGPGAEHNFSSGLLLYHLLTGNSQARDAVISLADWVLAMDDGCRTILGTVDEGSTGLASRTGDTLYHGPGRGSGNSIDALLNAWLIVHDEKYLRYSETLIQRCIHPQQDLLALNLSNAEKRWSYTIFLVSLSKYLDCKTTADEIDAGYEYAQASLLHVGRWMLENEQPYFDRMDELEYPTEAWPAQELRKANAIRLAAQHADEPWRTRMLDRGDELAERAWSDLMGFPTRTTARAMAVVMVEGLRDAALRQRRLPPVPVPSGSSCLPPQQPFLPQRERVMAGLRSPLGVLQLLAKVTPTKLSRLFNPL
jgi:YetA-like protein